MSEVRVGINGLGRTGRCVLKNLMQRSGSLSVVAVNDLARIEDVAYLLKYDSVHGWYRPRISHTDVELRIDGRRMACTSVSEPREIPWSESGVEVVIECTGQFHTHEQAAGHITGGARKVIVSAPGANMDGTFVLGVNGHTYDRNRHHVVSMGSCTTNSLAPVAKVLQERWGIEHLFITTVHAYTSDQSLTDVGMANKRHGRAASLSIVPSTTGAARATALVIPELEGRMDGLALRVPVPDGSVTDIVATLRGETDVEELNQAFRDASLEPRFQGILRVADDPIVSSDILGDSHSAVVDSLSTMVLRDQVVKVLVWYDNEWAYAARLVDFAQLMADAGL